MVISARKSALLLGGHQGIRAHIVHQEHVPARVLESCHVRQTVLLENLGVKKEVRRFRKWRHGSKCDRQLAVEEEVQFRGALPPEAVHVEVGGGDRTGRQAVEVRRRLVGLAGASAGRILQPRRTESLGLNPSSTER